MLAVFLRNISKWWLQSNIIRYIRFSLLYFQTLILTFFPLWVVEVVSPFQWLSSFFFFFFFYVFEQSLSSDRSLFPGFVSVICGHYTNIHGCPEEWEKGYNTHPEVANHQSKHRGGHFVFGVRLRRMRPADRPCLSCIHTLDICV